MKLLHRIACRIVGHDFVFLAEAGRSEPTMRTMHIQGLVLPVCVADVQIKQVCTRCKAAQLVRALEIVVEP